MALDFALSDSASIGATEYFLASDSTTKADQTDDCILMLVLYAVSIAAGDEFVVRLYEKITGAAGTQRSIELGRIVGPNAGPFWFPVMILGHGWEISIQKTAGTDRTIEWSLRKAN
jgi:hypothetical protein